mmetsp:Transcript_12532/g.41007  ORF Transcript_12532/g.41007 Transcript_12532/m.41007 type:complete len:105 (-) Transcript_12532:164-478(-)
MNETSTLAPRSLPSIRPFLLRKSLFYLYILRTPTKKKRAAFDFGSLETGLPESKSAEHELTEKDLASMKKQNKKRVQEGGGEERSASRSTGGETQTSRHDWRRP